MGKSYFLIFSVIAGIFAVGFFVQAASPFDIKFPVAELGNCANEAQCSVYCDTPANQNACIAFAKSHGLIETEDAERAEKLVALGPEFVGPGGCRNEEQCMAYCESIDHLEECLAFAQDHDLMGKDELDEARRVLVVKQQGVQTPGGCNSKTSCETYCENPDNIIECVEFGEKAGFVSKQEAEMMRRTGGVGPGGCKGRQCETFCEDQKNFDVCVDFAAQNGLMSDEEYEEAQKVKQALAKGASIPGDCRSKQCAEEYCANPLHINECTDFGVAAGFMTEKEAQIMKTRGKFDGPGGCRSERECRAYCESPEHGEECIQFAVEAGFMDPDDAEVALKMVRHGKGTFDGPGGCKGEECKTYCDDQSHAEECIDFAVENGFMEPEEAEQAKKFMASGKEGPGGCRGAECKTYCDNSEHGQECFKFGVENGIIAPEEAERAQRMMTQGGPGGCKGRECETFCSDPSHGEECIHFAVEIGEMSQEEADEILEFMKMGGPGGPGGFGPPGGDEGDFEGFGPPGGGRGFGPGDRGGQGFGPGGGFHGPGGCSSPSECQAFCTNPDNFDECFGQRPDEFGSPPEFEGQQGEGSRSGPIRNQRMPQKFPSDFKGGGREFDDDEFSGEFPHDEFGAPEDFEGEFDRQSQQEFQKQFEEQSRQQFDRQMQQQFPQGVSPEQLKQSQQQFQQGISPEQLQQMKQLPQLPQQPGQNQFPQQQFPQQGAFPQQQFPQQPTDFQQFPQQPPPPSSSGGGVRGFFKSVLDAVGGR